MTSISSLVLSILVILLAIRFYRESGNRKVCLKTKFLLYISIILWNIGTFIYTGFDLSFDDVFWFTTPLIVEFIWQISCMILLYHFFKRASKADKKREIWTYRIKVVIIFCIFTNLFVICMIIT